MKTVTEKIEELVAAIKDDRWSVFYEGGVIKCQRVGDEMYITVEDDKICYRDDYEAEAVVSVASFEDAVKKVVDRVQTVDHNLAVAQKQDVEYEFGVVLTLEHALDVHDSMAVNAAIWKKDSFTSTRHEVEVEKITNEHVRIRGGWYTATQYSETFRGK